MDRGCIFGTGPVGMLKKHPEKRAPVAGRINLPILPFFITHMQQG
jgi:hypothetical protein